MVLYFGGFMKHDGKGINASLVCHGSDLTIGFLLLLFVLNLKCV